MKQDENIYVEEGMIDTHFHLLHLKDSENNNIKTLNKAFSKGLSLALDIGLSARDIKERTKKAMNNPKLFLAHGMYPSECNKKDLSAQLSILKKSLSSNSKAIAVGEIGLDFFHNYGDENKQRDLFVKQISIANELTKPVIIHSRNAEKETIQILKKYRPKSGGIIHCYSYSKETAFKFIDMGFYISFAGNVTYKKNSILQEAAAIIPLDSLLIETDAPYLSPQRVRGKNNHPGLIGYTYEYISLLRKTNLDNIVNAVKINFKKCMGLP